MKRRESPLRFQSEEQCIIFDFSILGYLRSGAIRPRIPRSRETRNQEPENVHDLF
jgi:hypothetical protein